MIFQFLVMKESLESNFMNRRGSSCFPDEVLERVIRMLKSRKDRSSVSLVCKKWYNAERWSRRNVFIGNCYFVSPEILTPRFPNIRSVTLKGKPRFFDFNLVPANWGADIHFWLVVFAEKYPFLKELRLKRMTVTDESLKFLARSFPNFKAISLQNCDGFSTDGLAAIAADCKNLTELDIQENVIDDKNDNWLTYFPESFTSLEVLNFSIFHNDVNFDAIEKLVTRCKSLKTLKLNKSIALEQLQRLLFRAPQLCELVKPQYLPVLYPACANMTFLNFSYAPLDSDDIAKLLVYCANIRRLWFEGVDLLSIELNQIGKASKMVEHHYVNASDLNLLEAHEAEASLAGRGAYTLMVGLTLIQIAAAKGAGLIFTPSSNQSKIPFQSKLAQKWALQEFTERKDNGKMAEGSKGEEKVGNSDSKCSVACCSIRGRRSCCRCGHCSFNRVYIVESTECT
ncbi:Protein TRANSPORT INHIBITOR RESPONSE [Arachis hypogaea]|nr:Protein TRANSPORT INHIBITOR RESPONSE [Arachis hypogaea]